MISAKKLPVFLMAVLLLFALLPMSVWAAEARVSDGAAFQAALKKGSPVIYVSDFAFEKETEITLNYNVKIVGATPGATIQNACFTVVGANTPAKG